MKAKILLILSILAVFPSFSFAWWHHASEDQKTSDIIALPDYATTKGGGGDGLLYFCIYPNQFKLTVDTDFQVHKFLPDIERYPVVYGGTTTFDISEGKTLILEQIASETSESIVNRIGNYNWKFTGKGNFTLQNSYFFSTYDADGNLAKPVWDFTGLTGTVTFGYDSTKINSGITIKAKNLIANGFNVIDANLTVENYTSTRANGTSGYMGDIIASGNSNVDITMADGQRMGEGKVTASGTSKIKLDFSKNTSKDHWTSPITAGDQSTVTIIGSSKNFNNSKFAVTGDGATLNLSNNATMFTYYANVVSGGTLNMSAKVIRFFEQATTWGTAGSSKGATVNITTGDLGIGDTASITVSGTGTVVSLSSSAINLGYGVNTKEDTWTLNINTSNPFTNATKDSAQGDCFELNIHHSGNLNLGARNDFYSLNFKTASILNVELNDNIMTFKNVESFIDAEGNYSYVLFSDFDEKLVIYEGFRDALAFNDDGTLKNFKAMKDGSLTDLYLLDDGYLSFSNIPEPSTYAIFAGLIALGLAIYRRRK